MDEEDHDELLICTDDESLSENEEHCLPRDKTEETPPHTLIYHNHTRLEFLTTKVTLILSSTFLLILLPLYTETINVDSDVYTMILTNTLFSLVLLVLIIVSSKVLYKKYNNIEVFSFPLGFWKLLQLSVVYFLSGFMIVYAVDRKRVLCHLQDPIKGIILVFSLLYYFFFCRKLMGLQRIFSATTIIVGLFISVDYGLCDEFRCRGFERERVADDTGNWSWQTHSIWTTVYIIGIALFAAYFTLLDSFLLYSREEDILQVDSSSFLSTVSQTVSFSNSTSSLNNLIKTRATDTSSSCKKLSAIHIAMWIHVLGFAVVLLLSFTDIIPTVGKASNTSEFLENAVNGFSCHFKLPTHGQIGVPPCGNMILYSWIFLCTYLLFSVMSIKFMMLSQSAVYTVSTITASLPLVGIWWSLFHMTPVQNGLLTWAPSITGELICSLLGLPIVLVGLCLLCKSHFKDYQWSRLSAPQIMSSNQLA